MWSGDDSTLIVMADLMVALASIMQSKEVWIAAQYISMDSQRIMDRLQVIWWLLTTISVQMETIGQSSHSRWTPFEMLEGLWACFVIVLAAVLEIMDFFKNISDLVIQLNQSNIPAICWNFTNMTGRHNSVQKVPKVPTEGRRLIRKARFRLFSYSDNK